MESRTVRCAALSATWLFCALIVQQVAGANQVAGLVASEPAAALVKRFSVPAGSVILGVEFVNNDDRTVFPKVAIFSGPATRLSEATMLAEGTNVRSSSPHRVRMTVSPLAVETARDLFVAVTFPASSGVRGASDGAGIGANQLSASSPTSYIAPTVEEYFQPIDLELGIELLFRSVGKTAPSADTEASFRTFLGTAAPNPSTSIARIEFGVERRMPVKLGIYSIAGRRVRLLAEESMDAGVHTVHWDGKDQRGETVAAGVYVAKLQAGGKVLTQKMVIAK